MSVNLCGLINIGEKDVPDFLRKSPLFKEMFAEDDKENIAIPADCFIQTSVVNTDDQLRILCKTVRFWLIPEHLKDNSDVFKYLLNHPMNKPCDFLDDGLKRELPILDKLLRATSRSNLSAIMKRAIKLDLVGLVEYMTLNHYSDLPPKAMATAASSGSLDTLKYFHQKCDFQLLCEHVRIAANRGHLKCLQYLHQRGCIIDLLTCEYAAAGGHLKCLKYICEHCGVSIALCRNVLTRATISSVPCLQYLLKKGCPWNESAAVHPAREGNLEALKCLHENEVPFPVVVSTAAAFYGHLECLQYIVEHGGAVTVRTMNSAALGGKLECIKYLQQVGCPWNSKTCQEAAARGHLSCLQFLHENGCPWSAWTTAMAARNDNEDCLRYALQHGCASCADAIDYIACNGDLAWLQQLQSSDQWDGKWDEHMCSITIEAGSLECLQYALESGGVEGALACTVAAELGSLRLLQLLHQRGCEWDVKVCEAAQKNDAVDCLAYALENGCPWDYSVNMQAKRCAAYLRKHNYW